MKKTLNQTANLLYAFLFMALFLIGNRVGLIFEVHTSQGKDIFKSLLIAVKDFFPSFDELYLGTRIGITPIPLLFGFVFVGGVILINIYSQANKKPYRVGEEHGSARYGKVETEAEKLKDSDNDNNMIMSQNVQISMNTRQTFLNDNVLVIGGSGSGKTRFHVKPNILQMSCNYIITDPKGSLIPEVAHAFEVEGYDIKILNLVDMSKSMKFNPLKYIYKPNDVLKFINNLVESTSNQNKLSGGDDFFVKAEIAFLTALVYYVLAVGWEDEKNINTVMDLIDLAEASEQDETAESVLDVMFNELKEENQALREAGMLHKNDYGYLAERQYSLYKKAAGETAKSILISVGVRMAVFNIPEVANLLSDDELDLRTIGEPKRDKNGNLIKTVLFCTISDSDSTFSFIASILYQQLYDMLYMIADNNEGGRLPIHTRFIQDEFANISKQKDFEIKIATMRSREISVCVILQNLAQLKNLYKDSWETIFGNADTTLFLGGKEPSTLEYISKLIGNQTIMYKSISETKGGQGSWSQSDQLINRPLLAPDEIGRLGTDECLIHIRGYHIFRDKKYKLESHKRINYTTDAPDKSLAKSNRFNLDKFLEEGYIPFKKEEPIEVDGELNVTDNVKKHYFSSNILTQFYHQITGEIN